MIFAVVRLKRRDSFKRIVGKGAALKVSRYLEEFVCFSYNYCDLTTFNGSCKII